MRTGEIYSGEVWELDFQADRWRQVLTSWGTLVEDDRFITNEQIFQKGSNEYRCRSEPFDPSILKLHPEYGVKFFDLPRWG